MHEHEPYNEPELLRQVAEGSEDAFRRLFDAYRPKLYTYIYRVTGSRETTEDIVQDVFLQIWTSRERLTDIHNLNAYLHKAAHHAAYRSLEKVAKEELVLHVLKAEAGTRHSPETSESIAATDPTRPLLSKEIRQKIHDLVDRNQIDRRYSRQRAPEVGPDDNAPDRQKSQCQPPAKQNRSEIQRFLMLNMNLLYIYSPKEISDYLFGNGKGYRSPGCLTIWKIFFQLPE